jgi:abhydrolase domain-containing protein 14
VLAEAGFYAVAIDLPGFGLSDRWQANPQTLLVELLDALKLAAPVVLAPSLSGRFAFPLILKHPEKVAGFVPIAAVGTPVAARQLKQSPVPTLVVWGAKDRMFPAAAHAALAASFLNSEVLSLPGASHPAYLDQPDLFHQALLKFLSGLAESAEEIPAGEGPEAEAGASD